LSPPLAEVKTTVASELRTARCIAQLGREALLEVQEKQFEETGQQAGYGAEGEIGPGVAAAADERMKLESQGQGVALL